MVLTFGVKDLVARGKTRQEIAKYIDSDDVIFQDLNDLKAACIEAAEGTTQVEGFEEGVFSGKYVTEVPEGYFRHLSELRNGKRAQGAGVTIVKAGGDEGSVVTSSGPVNRPPEGDEADAFWNANTIKRPEDCEDIRYVVSDIELLCVYLLTLRQSLQHCKRTCDS